MAEPTFFFNRKGTRSGPHTPEEMAAFIREGLVFPWNWVLREGDPKWTPASSHPELQQALAEQDAATRPAATTEAASGAAAAVAPAAPSPPVEMHRQSSYAPGTPVPGFFLRFDDPAEAVARRAEALIADEAADRVRRSSPRRKAFWLLVAATVLAFFGDVVADDGSWLFTSTLVPIAFLASVWVALVTHPDPRGALTRARAGVFSVGGGCLVAVSLGVLMVVATILAGPGGFSTFVRLYLVLLVCAAALAIRFRLGLPASGAGSASRERLAAAVEALRLVEDELPAGRTASGWIDLSGAEGPTKRMSTGTTASGWQLDVFRDEWFHAEGVLRDGSRLRLSAVERRRVKRDRWKTGASGKRKLKSGDTRTAHMLEMRLRAGRTGTASVSVPCRDPFAVGDVVRGFAALRDAVHAPSPATPPAGAAGGAA